METEEILNECKDIVEKVCLKYNYDSQDKEGNDSLKTVLLKAVYAMIKDSKKEDRELFYQMLNNTPIVITENLTQESYSKLLDQYIGKDLNKHIIDGDIDLGEYGKRFGAGEYASEVILDENMIIQGKKSFIYVQKATGKQKEFYGTDINVSHLIHELGHAWHAEKEQYIMQNDGTLKERVGTAEFIYSFSKTQDNKFIRKCEKVTGLMLEESMNTISEEIAMANYMNLSLEEMKKEYGNTLIPSRYQGYMSNLVSYMLEELGKDDFESFRLYGDTESKNRINTLMAETKFWKNRQIDILPSSNSTRNYDKKRDVINRIDDTKFQDFFKKYESTYFPDISKMTPLEKIDNVLEQYHNLDMMKYRMGVDNFGDFIQILCHEAYPLINQTANLIKLNMTEGKKEITPFQAVKSALKQTTKDKVDEAIGIEIAEKNLDSIREGETKDD